MLCVCVCVYVCASTHWENPETCFFWFPTAIFLFKRPSFPLISFHSSTVKMERDDIYKQDHIINIYLSYVNMEMLKKAGNCFNWSKCRIFQHKTCVANFKMSINFTWRTLEVIYLCTMKAVLILQLWMHARSFRNFSFCNKPGGRERKREIERENSRILRTLKSRHSARNWQLH